MKQHVAAFSFELVVFGEDVVERAAVELAVFLVHDLDDLHVSLGVVLLQELHVHLGGVVAQRAVQQVDEAVVEFGQTQVHAGLGVFAQRNLLVAHEHEQARSHHVLGEVLAAPADGHGGVHRDFELSGIEVGDGDDFHDLDGAIVARDERFHALGGQVGERGDAVFLGDAKEQLLVQTSALEPLRRQVSGALVHVQHGRAGSLSALGVLLADELALDAGVLSGNLPLLTPPALFAVRREHGHEHEGKHRPSRPRSFGCGDPFAT